MTFFLDNYTFAGPLDPREINGITFIGPDFFETDEEGNLRSPIGSVFPKYKTIITVRGIHACHASIAYEYFRQKLQSEGRVPDEDLEPKIYEDAVALLIRESVILIRSDPIDMEHIFAADDILQSFLPKHRIQFTGLHIPEVRNQLRGKGESWRMSPAPKSVREIAQYVRASMVRVSTGLSVYYNAPTGGRFLTFAEFMRIQPLLRSDPAEALARLKEIRNLLQRLNSWGNRELSFFLPAGKKLEAKGIEAIIALMDTPGACGRTGQILESFDRFADQFAAAAGPELSTDDVRNPLWRTTMFCRLYDINEEQMEEWSLGLSPEFHLNVKWLPGATVTEGQLRFDPGVHQRTQGLIEHFWNQTGGFSSINIGHVEASLTTRDISGEQRDVYLVVMSSTDADESIRLIRLMKWDVFQRVKMGVPVEQAVAATISYRNYIFDRLRAAALLGFPILSYREIRLTEEIPGIGQVPSFFFDRQYVQGIVTDKIPDSYYRHPQFITNLSSLLGAAASFSLILGRASPRTGKIYYDDGDELVQFDFEGIPTRLIIIETTGSFTDWTTPLMELLPQCLNRFHRHLEKAHTSGIAAPIVYEAVSRFADALVERMSHVRKIVASPSSNLKDLFKSREPEPGGIRNRWDAILQRLEATDLQQLRDYTLKSPELDMDSWNRP
ncbi:MAG: hypothetical protein LLG06_03885 [Desulfobacteraceae bacterium]|nr:hypothetical protein [Desulfobacteraceae bacterium]